MPLITAFGEKHPAVRFEITNRTSSETAELIRWRKADIGFINLPVCGDEFLISECLRMNNVLVAGEKYAYLASRTLNLSELAGLPMIMLEKKSSQRLQTDENLKEIGVELHPILELGSIDLIISFVINNHGLAFIPKELCGRFTDGEKLTVIKTEPTLKEIALTMIELKHIPISHAAYHFKKFVLENIRPNRQSFS
jgi:DNA-binding transcriptional LysR family regulator